MGITLISCTDKVMYTCIKRVGLENNQLITVAVFTCAEILINDSGITVLSYHVHNMIHLASVTGHDRIHH